MRLPILPPMDLAKIADARDFGASGAARLVRLTSGISLREMGRAVGVDAATILKWERGEHRPRGAAAIRWTDELTRLAERKQNRPQQARGGRMR